MPKSQETENQNLLVGKFFQDHRGDRHLTHHHFRALGISKRRINLVIERVLQGQDLHYNKKSGPKPTATSDKNTRKAMDLFIKNPKMSVRDAAYKMGVSVRAMDKIRKIAGIKSVVRQKVPKMTEKQIESAKKCCSKLYKMSVPSGGNYFFIIDDETYMELDPQEAKKKQFVSLVPGHEIPIENRIVQKSRFPAKMLVWQAIAEDGQVSPAYVASYSMNADIYRNQCLKKILVPWIRSLDLDRPVLFWPDKASSHYAHITVDFLKANNIEFVNKMDNPTSAPQV